MGYEDITRDLTNMLQEREVEVFILKPGQFQISVDVCAIGVSIPEISVVVLTI